MAEEEKSQSKARASGLKASFDALPRLVKTLGATLVALASIAGGVAAIVPLVTSSGEPSTSVRIYPEGISLTRITLGQYIDYERAQAHAGTLRASNGTGGGPAAAVGIVSASIDPSAAISSKSFLPPSSEQNTGPATPPSQTPTSTQSSSASAQTTGTPSGTTGSSSIPAQSSSSTAGSGQASSSGTSPASRRLFYDFNVTQILHEAQGALSSPQYTILASRIMGEEQLLDETISTDEPEISSCTPGDDFGSCASGEGKGPAASEEVELIHSGQTGHSATPLPRALIAGLSPAEQARFERVLGDVAQFRVDIQGYPGKRLFLEWSMLTKRAGGWQPLLSNGAVQVRLESYVVSSSENDQGVLSFWFPLPKARGTYKVNYAIVVPNEPGVTADSKNTPSFH